jgi:hypothetical protein
MEISILNQLPGYMKLFYIVFIMVVVLLIFMLKSQSFNIAKNICDYVAVDDKGRLRKLLKSNHLKLRKVFKNVACDSHNLLIFARKKMLMKLAFY